MKNIALTALAAIPCIISTASASTLSEYSAAFEEQKACIRELTTLLNAISDKSSADAACPRAEFLFKRILELDDVIESLSDVPSRDEDKLTALVQSYVRDMKILTAGLESAGERIGENDFFNSQALMMIFLEMLEATEGVDD